MADDPNEAQATPEADPVAGKTVAEILGEIVWLMTQDPAGREMKVSEIERLVMPAILQKRFHIEYMQVPDTIRARKTALQPVSVNIYAADSRTSPLDKQRKIEICYSLPSWKKT